MQAQRLVRRYLARRRACGDRVCSLRSSPTELLWKLELRAPSQGVTHECELIEAVLVGGEAERLVVSVEVTRGRLPGWRRVRDTRRGTRGEALQCGQKLLTVRLLSVSRRQSGREHLLECDGARAPPLAYVEAFRRLMVDPRAEPESHAAGLGSETLGELQQLPADAL